MMMISSSRPPRFLSWKYSTEEFSCCSRGEDGVIQESLLLYILQLAVVRGFKVATLNRLKVCHNDILKRLLGCPGGAARPWLSLERCEHMDVIRRHSVFKLREACEPGSTRPPAGAVMTSQTLRDARPSLTLSELPILCPGLRE
ncbi:hypothetical protein GWK47_013235 [Chionoecetes opilio]|uniref:Uncharacterized protein n=1 Tax=Chionoecetes opilio TaxID=41210 RepID=A0A8J5CKP5_CHIOP|nr:hypothetical protein GWK47_013235 [Chionoecetes opilio]